MKFENVIINLIESAQHAWNNSELEKFNDFMEDDIIITMEAVTVGGVNFPEQNIKGKESAMEFIRKYRHVLPLRYKAQYEGLELKKKSVYNKYFYELKISAQFNCVISEYGRYKQFHISKYQNAKNKNITALYIIRNIISHKLKSIFSKPERVAAMDY